MNERDLETAVLRALEQAARGSLSDRPIEPEALLADQFELDEPHFFRALARETGIDIPEEDQPGLTTLAACLEYLSSGLAE